MDDQEKVALDAEWKKMGGMGRTLARKRLVAPLLSILAALPFFIGGFVGMVMFSPRLLLACIPGVALGAMVRKAMWPKSQFE